MRIKKTIFAVVALMALTIVLVAFVRKDSNASSSKPIKFSETLNDPLFGIEYRPSEVHFEKAPDSIYQCKDIEPERRELFLFGKAVKDNRTFYLVYGFLEAEADYGEDAEAKTDSFRYFAAEDDGGIIVVVSSDGCSDIGAGYAWSTSDKSRKKAEQYGITKDVVLALIDDAIEREIHAFGGKAELLRKISSSSWVFPPLVQDRLDNLKKSNK